MSDWLDSFGPIEWFRDQFIDGQVTAWSMFRLVLLSWALAAVVFILLDRANAALLGRSRPLAQVPPERARTWRWGRRIPPTTYSMLPPGTTVESTKPVLVPTTSLERPLALMAGEQSQALDLPDPAADLEDTAFWRLFAENEAPVLGYENGVRLGHGEAPERYNPVTGRVEALERDATAGTLAWTWKPDGSVSIGEDS